MGNFPKSISRIILVITLLKIAIVVRGVHSQGIQYPTVLREEEVVDDYHGTKVKDPYRWLEERDAERVSDFVGDQNELTFTYLKDCQQRSQFKERLEELWSYPKYGRPEKRGSRYFYLAQQRAGEVLYVQETKASLPRVLIDPQENGSLAFPSLGVSRDGELVAYMEVVKQEELPQVTENIRILNVSSGEIYPEIIENVRNPQIGWDKGSKGFFYFSHKKYDESSEEEEESSKFHIYYHKVGTRRRNDVLAVEFSDFLDEPDFVDMEVSEDGEYLMLRSKSFRTLSNNAIKTSSTFYVARLSPYASTGVTEKLQIIPVINRENSAFVKYVTNIGNLFYFRSRIGSKNYRLVEVDLANPAENSWRVVIEENSSYVLQAANGVDKSKVLLSYTSPKLNSYTELRDLKDGSLIRMFPLEFGELLSFSGNIDDSEVLFRSNKLEGLPELYYFDASNPQGPMKPLVHQPPLRNYNRTGFVTEVVSFPNSEGESVEMILLYRKDFKRDGSAYVFMVEREFELDFYFRIYFSYMVDFNAVVAFPHLEERNGNGFRDSALEDFIKSAEYLVKHGYSRGSRIIARGQSTFGLFVAAAVNRRPDLFGATIPSMVAFDMLRYDAATNWTAASKDDDRESFKRTYGVSPLHGIQVPANESVQYPGIFIPTPNEYPIPLAFKYLAELQHTLGPLPRQRNPFLMRVVPEPRGPVGSRYYAYYHIDRESYIRCFLEKVVDLRMMK